MGCNCSPSRRIIVHEVRKGGSTKRFLTEAEARREVALNGGDYVPVSKGTN